MIKTKTIEIKETVLVVEDVLCNKCGQSLARRFNCGDGDEDAFKAPSAAIDRAAQSESVDLRPVVDRGVEFYGLVECSVSGGYLSDELEDFTSYRFSLCEACLAGLFDSFATPPGVTSPLSRWARPDDRAEAEAAHESYGKVVEARRAEREARRVGEEAEKDRLRALVSTLLPLARHADGCAGADGDDAKSGGCSCGLGDAKRGAGA